MKVDKNQNPFIFLTTLPSRIYHKNLVIWNFFKFNFQNQKKKKKIFFFFFFLKKKKKKNFYNNFI